MGSYNLKLSETPKKKKNIIRVFHAQNASDGGKTRKKPVKAEGERIVGVGTGIEYQQKKQIINQKKK